MIIVPVFGNMEYEREKSTALDGDDSHGCYARFCGLVSCININSQKDKICECPCKLIPKSIKPFPKLENPCIDIELTN
jgi:hypothetical protein